jgi:SAM-dependent methyltransferase
MAGSDCTCDDQAVSLTPDYDSDPERWTSWVSPKDAHEMVAPELRGPVLDAGCAAGRLASLLPSQVTWVGLDSSPAQLAVIRRPPSTPKKRSPW